MTMIEAKTITIDGIETRVLSSSQTSTGAPSVFLHGGSPGVTPFCSGAHIWGSVLDAFAAVRQVVAPDLPGSGSTGFAADQVPTIDAIGRHVVALMQAMQSGPCHLVGHDEGGLVGLWLAMNAPERLRSLTVVASRSAAPPATRSPF